MWSPVGTLRIGTGAGASCGLLSLNGTPSRGDVEETDLLCYAFSPLSTEVIPAKHQIGSHMSVSDFLRNVTPGVYVLGRTD